VGTIGYPAAGAGAVPRLYDSAARAEEVLRLGVGDLDLANRQARARTKGGHTRPLHFQTAAAGCWPG
jgi:integrase